MSSSVDEKITEERRKFPRKRAHCQINYFTRSSGNWSEGQLQDFSANGISFTCDETLLQNTQITIQISDKSHKDVPPMAASAVVVRCELDDDHHYKIACKFTKVRPQKTVKINRFGPGYS